MNQNTGAKKIRAIIVDDERLAVKGLEILLKDFPQIEIAGSADCIDAAVQLFQKEQPDLIFLDIQLQGETGFDLFERVPLSAKVVFVTAYDEYAIRAFDVNAMDYLLKPVSRERLQVTIERVMDSDSQLPPVCRPFEYEDVIVINTSRSIKFVGLNKILSIAAQGDYSSVTIAGEKSELVFRSLKDWERLLPPKNFMRIDRSTIVNKAFIERVEKTTSNRFHLYLRNLPAPFVMSQRYFAKIKKKANHFLPI